MEVSVKTLKKIAEEIRGQNGDKYNNVFTACINATGRAIQFLNSQYGIVTVSELPSQTLLTVLSVFFYYHPRMVTEQQNKERNRDISKERPKASTPFRKEGLPVFRYSKKQTICRRSYKTVSDRSYFSRNKRKSKKNRR